MVLLLQNGTIVNAGNSFNADLLCSDGKIIKVGKNLQTNSIPDRIIDAGKCFILPGGIDPHVHLHLPTQAGFTADDFLSGSKGSLYGGTTTLIDFVTPEKKQALDEAIKQRKSEATLCQTDYSFHVSPVEWRPSMAEELKSSISQTGLKSFKVYLAYKDSIGLEDNALFAVMKTVGEAGGIVCLHCELGDEIEVLRREFVNQNKLTPLYHPLSRPVEFEANAVKKAIDLAKKADCPIYIVHVSAKESLNHISKAQQLGQKVYAETCPQYLLFDDSKYKGDFDDTAPFVMSPPLRKEQDKDALWHAIADGTIQTIGTDHCPFSLKQKQSGKDNFTKIPNGAGGVEHRLSLLYTFGVIPGKISLNRFVALTSANAAKIFGLFPEKGIIAEGSDADIIVWSDVAENTISVKNHHQNSDVNIYEGMKTKGSPVFVIKSGNIVLDNGQWITPYRGRFLKTSPF